MPFVKGRKKTGGKEKGTPNKDTSQIKEAYKNLIENNLCNISDWLERVADTDPDKALKYLNDLSEYVIPKLQRTTLDTPEDKEINIPLITWVKTVDDKDK